MKDWTGNKKSIFTTLGASSHSDHEREKHDYYATEPRVIDELFEREKFSDNIWECACGEGHLSKEIQKYTNSILSTDLIDRGFGTGNIDFLNINDVWNGDIITNPPYKYAQEFVEHAMKLIEKSELSGLKVAMFLKITFLEGQKRKELFKKYPPKVIYVYSSRRQCGLNGKFEGSSASCYAWFVWEKGFTGDPVIKWI
jgi:hypothetical protein